MHLLTQMVRFVGTAHSAPGECKEHVANMSSAEIDSTNLGTAGRGRTNVPVLIEHSGNPVGLVEASWINARGEMRVAANVSNERAIRGLKDGTMRGLSLGMATLDGNGGSTVRSVEELSLCRQPARPHCYVTHIEGKKVTSRHEFSGMPTHLHAPASVDHVF